MKHTTKKVMAALMAAVMTGCSSGTAKTSTAASALDTVKEEGVLRVALEGVWQPFCYHDSNGDLVGFDVEVAKGIAEYLGVEAEFYEGEFGSLFTGLDAGSWDIVANGADITEERTASYYMSEPYAYDHMVLVTAADNTTLTSFEGLKGLTTANSTGSTYALAAEEYGATVQNVPTLAETMTLVKSGTVDATLNAKTSVQDYFNTAGDEGLKIAAEDSEATAYGIVLKKDASSDTLLAEINKAIEDMRSSGKLAEISEKYFGADLTSE